MRSVLIFGLDILSPAPACQNSSYLTAGRTNRRKHVLVYDFIHMYVYVRVHVLLCIDTRTCVFNGLFMKKSSELLKLFLSWFHSEEVSPISQTAQQVWGSEDAFCQHASSPERDTWGFSGLVWNFALQHLLLNHFNLSVTLCFAVFLLHVILKDAKLHSTNPKFNYYYLVLTCLRNE